jgi:hypothetical protein
MVVVGHPVEARRQERARRKCIERLMYLLHTLGVSRVALETRTPYLNRRDSRMIDAMRGAQTIPSHLRLEFARPLDDPML